MIVDVFVVFGTEVEDGWWVSSVDAQIFGKSVEKSITIVFVGKGEEDSFGVGGIKGFEGLLCGSRLVVPIGEEEKGRLFILEDFLDSVVVEGDDFGVDVKDKDKGQENSFVHGSN